MNSAEKEFFRRRERAERAAAKIATCTEARRAHQELAQRLRRFGEAVWYARKAAPAP